MPPCALLPALAPSAVEVRVLNVRTTSSQKCAAIARRARI